MRTEYWLDVSFMSEWLCGFLISLWLWSPPTTEALSSSSHTRSESPQIQSSLHSECTKSSILQCEELTNDSLKWHPCSLRTLQYPGIKSSDHPLKSQTYRGELLESAGAQQHLLSKPTQVYSKIGCFSKAVLLNNPMPKLYFNWVVKY